MKYSLNAFMCDNIAAFAHSAELVGVDSPRFYWGCNEPTDYYVESGFFSDACWIDKVGCYGTSSLHDSTLIKLLETFQPQRDIVSDVLALSPLKRSKYPQPFKKVVWDKVVLLGQSSVDHSIGYQGHMQYDLALGHNRYIDWYRKTCQEFGSDLYVKLHPFVADSIPSAQIFKDIANECGCSIGNCDMSVIDKASMVVFYNSTAIVDCWMRGVAYRQYHRGTFDSIPPELGKQMVHFLMWKYCLPKSHSLETWESVFSLYHNSTELWPLPSELSWGQWAVNNLLTKEN